MEGEWSLWEKIYAGAVYGSIAVGIIMLLWPRPWVKKPKIDRKKLSAVRRQWIFYIMVVVCFLLSLSAGWVNFLFWSVVLAVSSIWLSGGNIAIRKENKRSGVLKILIPEILYKWIKAPFEAWRKVNTDEVSFWRVVKGVAIGSALVILWIMAMIFYYG